MNKPKLSEKKMLSVKFYRNLRRNLFYGIYFNKFHIHILHRYSVCDAFQLRGKKILHLREELKHMTIVRIFFVTFLFKAYFVFSYYFMAFISTDAATSFLPLYLLLWPSRNYLFCNHRPPLG